MNDSGTDGVYIYWEFIVLCYFYVLQDAMAMFELDSPNETLLTPQVRKETADMCFCADQ